MEGRPYLFIFEGNEQELLVAILIPSLCEVFLFIGQFVQLCGEVLLCLLCHRGCLNGPLEFYFRLSMAIDNSFFHFLVSLLRDCWGGNYSVRNLKRPSV